MIRFEVETFVEMPLQQYTVHMFPSTAFKN